MTQIAYQLYCSRNFPPLGGTLKMLADAGFAYVEGYGGLYDDVSGLKAGLETNGLQMLSGHFGLDSLEADPAAAIATAKALGIAKLFVPYLDADKRPTDADGWREFGARLVEAGKPINDAGLSFGWHNHDFEFQTLATGEMPIDLIAEASDDLQLELDLGWVQRAGQDPFSWISKYAKRIAAVHVKDIAPDGECTDEDGWADVGQGVMDWTAIHAALQEAGITHYVAEHDNPSDDKRFATRSFAAINHF